MVSPRMIGTPEFAVPTDIVDQWSVDEWIDRLISAPSLRNHGIPATEGRPRLYRMDLLVNELRKRASANPRNFMELATAMVQSTRTIPGSAYAAILESLGSPHRPQGMSGTWLPIADADYANLLFQPAFFSCENCAHAVSMAVISRPDFPWTEAMISRLTVIATDHPESFTETRQSNRDAVALYRLNSPPCNAIVALSKIAQRNADSRSQLLAFAKAMLEHHDIGRHAAAAMLAYQCRSFDSPCAMHIILAAASTIRVAADHEINEILLSLLWSQETPPHDKDQLHALVIRLYHQDCPYYREVGGVNVIALLAMNRVQRKECQSLLARDVVSRTAAAHQIRMWLTDRFAAAWIKEFALVLANDDAAKVQGAILLAFADHRCSYLLDDATFLAALAQSRAVKRDSTSLIKACDHHGNLLHMGEEILIIAHHCFADHDQTEAENHQHHDFNEVANLLIRLSDCASQTNLDELGVRARNAFDALIATGKIAPVNIWKSIAQAQDE